MKEIQEYTSILLSSDSRRRYETYKANLVSTFRKLEKLEIKNLSSFIDQTETKEKFEEFIWNNAITAEELIKIYKYLFNWFLPTKSYLRELVEKENKEQIQYITLLREYGIRFNLDLLDRGRTKVMRKNIAEETAVPEDFLEELVHKADFTRLPYIRGKSIKHYFNTEYKSLERLAQADLGQLEEEMREYLSKKGIELRRSFIELDNCIEQAKVLPKLVE